ncbi:MAG: FtsQ-type POTRA domain-containing protein [Candidatus Omnitrophica bacterium]|nr:FtsQ-type POTRA domain-containing protein [Candidatus Omnitrophota bacterium]
MARKKRKKAGKKGIFAGIGFLIKSSFALALKAAPGALVILLAGGLFLGVRQMLYADSTLAIQKITVDPATAISIPARANLESDLLGKNILQVNLKRVARSLENNPEIEHARVFRSLPSEIKIEVEKRQPIAFIQFSSRGSVGLISSDGMILDVFPKYDGTFILIEAFASGLNDPKIGMQFRSEGFAHAVKFIKAFWEHQLARRETITKIRLDHLGNVTVVLGTGPAIKLGRNPVEKLNDMEKIVHLLDGEGRKAIDYIDLQFDNVIIKRKG